MLIKTWRNEKISACAIVRPKLEYGGSLWLPHTIKHKALLENVQRRTTKFTLNYPQNMTYNDTLATLNLLPLEYR